MLISHPSSPENRLRVLSYSVESIEPELITVRETLFARGLLLGKPLNSAHDTEQSFQIPVNARPLQYDAGSQAKGIFTYADGQLFYDAGDLLGNLTEITHSRQVLKQEEIGRSIALREFTHFQDRRLLFVPGIERCLIAAPDDEIADYYADALQHEFGNRFSLSGDLFRTGFRQALLYPER